MMIPDDYIRRILNIIELLVLPVPFTDLNNNYLLRSVVPLTHTVSEQYGGARTRDCARAFPLAQVVDGE